MAARKGLADVVAAESEICFIDGKEGVLRYRGVPIEDLAEHASYEEVCHLLWSGDPPGQEELDALTDRLVRGRPLDDAVVDFLAAAGEKADPMDALRTGVSALGLVEPPGEDLGQAAERLTAVLPTIVAAHHRIREGKEPVPPRNDLTHAANFLYMLHGEEPDPIHVEAMDTALVLHADHGFNASTFSARVTASTLSDMVSAVTSAVGTLKGALHGGANQNVMRMLLDIGEVDAAVDHVQGLLDAGEKVPGFGHRVYKTLDPRARILKEMSKRAGEAAGETRWFEMSDRIQDHMLESKGLYANVDFYSASTYYALGIPTPLYTPIFSIARVAGWTAHVIEQLDDNKLIRPRAEYVGPGKRRWPGAD